MWKGGGEEGEDAARLLARSPVGLRTDGDRTDRQPRRVSLQLCLFLSFEFTVQLGRRGHDVGDQSRSQRFGLTGGRRGIWPAQRRSFQPKSDRVQRLSL